MTHNRSVSPQAAQIRRDGGWCSGWSNNEFRLNWIQSKPAAPNSKNVLQSWAAFNLFKCLDSRNDQLRLVRFLVDQTSSPSSRMVAHDRMLPKNLYQFVWQTLPKPSQVRSKSPRLSTTQSKAINPPRWQKSDKHQDVVRTFPEFPWSLSNFLILSTWLPTTNWNKKTPGANPLGKFG